ncbi:hypothetical protein V2J09_007300 [Rumex salicifolius]
MASNFLAGLIFVFLVAPISVYGATTHNVDWSISGSYSSWASTSVEVGDTIVFTYGSTHSVDVVSKDAYASCDASSATFTDNSGKTSYPLSTAGAVYFICGTTGHCPPMKLQLNVKAAGSSSTTNTTASTPTSPSTTTTTTTNGASGHGLSWVVFGVLVVFGGQ